MAKKSAYQPTLANSLVCGRCKVKWSYTLHERVETNNGVFHNGCVAPTDKVLDRKSYGGNRKPEPEKEVLKAAITLGADNGDGTYDAAKVFANVNAIAAGVA